MTLKPEQIERVRWRLGPRIVARRYDTPTASRIILKDERSMAVTQLQANQWILVSCADGTRDVHGLRAAAERAGAFFSAPQVLALVTTMVERGILVHPAGRLPGVKLTRRHGPLTRDGETKDARIERLSGYCFRCDGKGGCCRIFHTVVFTEEEVERARAFDALHRFRKPDEPPWLAAFSPAVSDETAVGYSVATRSGRCGFLAADGACGLHREGGASAKPFGCQTFPVRRVFDGTACRLTVRPDCACVFSSAGEPPPQFAGLGIHDGASTTQDLPPRASVVSLPATIAVCVGTTIPRDQFRRWTEAVEKEDPPDVVDALRRLASHALVGECPWPPRRDPVDLAPLVARIAERAVTFAERNAEWRASDDLVRVAGEAVAEAAVLLCDAEILDAAQRPRDIPDEKLFLRIQVFGYGFVGSRPLRETFAEAAVELLIARLLSVTRKGDANSEWRHPIALVHALFHAHGLLVS